MKLISVSATSFKYLETIRISRVQLTMYRVHHSIELTDDWGRLQADARDVVQALLPNWSSLSSSQIQASA